MWWAPFLVRGWWNPDDPQIPPGTPAGGVPVEIWSRLPGAIWSPWKPPEISLWSTENGHRYGQIIFTKA